MSTARDDARAWVDDGHVSGFVRAGEMHAALMFIPDRAAYVSEFVRHATAHASRRVWWLGFVSDLVGPTRPDPPFRAARTRVTYGDVRHHYAALVDATDDVRSAQELVERYYSVRRWSWAEMHPRGWEPTAKQCPRWHPRWHPWCDSWLKQVCRSRDRARGPRGRRAA